MQEELMNNSQFNRLLDAALQCFDNPHQLKTIWLQHCATPQDFQNLALEEENEMVVQSKGQLGALLAAMRLGRLMMVSRPVSYGIAYSSNELGKLMIDRLAGKTCEEVVVACTNVHNEIIGIRTMFRGGQAECHVYPEEILRYGLKSGAHGLVMIHNHPSGDPTPSECDLKLMKRLHTACTIVGLQLLDCLVTGKKNYYSLREAENSQCSVG